MNVKVVIYFLFILLALSSGALTAQPGFQGKVEAVFSYKGDDTKINYYTKDGIARVELELSNKGKKSVIILKEGSLFILIPGEKRYTESPIKLKNKIKSYMGDSLNKNIVKTNDVQKILGNNATKWTFQGNTSRIELWNTTELGNLIDFDKITGFNTKSQPNWVKNLISGGFFPLLVNEFDNNNKKIRSFEVKKIEKQDVSNDLFTIPADYKKMNKGK